ncbi:unnamed protein product, partial [Staurois parvus]
MVDSCGTAIEFHTQFNECLSRENIFALYGNKITEENFQTACPALLYLVYSKPCDYEETTNQRPSPAQVWGFSILSVSIINVTAMIGLFITP